METASLTAAILRSGKEEILENWFKEIKESIPSVIDYSKASIKNSLPDLMDAIITNLESDNPQDVIFHSQHHGHVRTMYDEYSLRHVIKEYNVLKSKIFNHLDQHTAVLSHDRNIIMNAIDQAIEQAAETFYKIREGVHVDARKIAEKKADELKLEDEQREEFIHSISHDLNNPLNNIKTCVVLLENDLDIDKVGEVLNILKSSIDKAEFMIKDFLDAGQVVTGSPLPVKKREVDILDDLRKEIKVYQIAQDKNIELIATQDKIMANLDVRLFRRAFYNLMNNALKYARHDSVISVECMTKEAELTVSVHNFGEMISEKAKKSIFNRYYQLDNGNQGWGLGLSLVKKVAESHGGKVEVESTEEKGTSFRIRLPLN